MDTSGLSCAVGEDDDVEEEEDTGCQSWNSLPLCSGRWGGAEEVNLSHFSPPSCPLGPDAHRPGHHLMMKMALEFLESDAEGRLGLLLLQHGVRPLLQIRVRGVRVWKVKGVSLGKCTEKVGCRVQTLCASTGNRKWLMSPEEEG